MPQLSRIVEREHSRHLRMKIAHGLKGPGTQIVDSLGLPCW